MKPLFPSFALPDNETKSLATKKNLLGAPVACNRSCDAPCSHAQPHSVWDCMTVTKRQDCPACELVFLVIEEERELPTAP
jgi:hypothetical protein